MDDKDSISSKVAQHINLYLKKFPHQYIGQDSLSMVLAYFCLSGLDLTDHLEAVANGKRQEMIDWIYDHQILPINGTENSQFCGFRGSMSNCGKFDLVKSAKNNNPFHDYDTSHATMTYASLCCLLILGDDLSRVNRDACLSGLAALQCEDGGISCSLVSGEKDARFVYSAIVSCYILDDFSYIDVEKAIEYMLNCQSYEGGFGSTPASEAHGGPTYCVIASLSLLGRLDSCIDPIRKERLLRWCIHRYNEGFHGRPDKQDDSCYTFWLGATLKILGAADMISRKRVLNFVRRCQCPATGGFAKHAQKDGAHGFADIMHTYLASAGLSCLGVPEFSALRAQVNITERAHLHLLEVQRKWREK